MTDSAAKPRREDLGRQVRNIWVAWAELEPNAKPSWLIPWDGLDEAQREVDMRIGAELWLAGYAAMARYAIEELEKPT